MNLEIFEVLSPQVPSLRLSTVLSLRNKRSGFRSYVHTLGVAHKNVQPETIPEFSINKSAFDFLPSLVSRVYVRRIVE